MVDYTPIPDDQITETTENPDPQAVPNPVPAQGNVSTAVGDAASGIGRGLRKLTSSEIIGQGIDGFGGDLANLPKAFNRGITNLLGMPADLVNMALRQVNIPEIRGGNRDLQGLFNYIGIQTQTDPKTVAGRFLDRIAEELGAGAASLGPQAAVQKLAGSAQRLVAEALADPRAFFRRETYPAVGAGVAAQGVHEAGEKAGYEPNPVAELAGSVAGAVAGSRVAGAHPGRLGLTEGRGNAGREFLVGKALEQSATPQMMIDPVTGTQALLRPTGRQLIDNIDQGVREIESQLPGAQPTTAQASGNRGLASTERGMTGDAPDSSGQISDRRIATNAAIEEAITPPGVGPRSSGHQTGDSIRRDIQSEADLSAARLKTLEDQMPYGSIVDVSALAKQLQAERRQLGMGERANMSQYWPKPLADFQKMMQTNRGSNNALTFDDLIPIRREAQSALERAMKSSSERPEVVQRLQAFIGQLDDALGTSFQAARDARKAHTDQFATGNAGAALRRDAAGNPTRTGEQVADSFLGGSVPQPQSFRQLMQATGHRPTALNEARNYLHYNFMDAVTTPGSGSQRIFDPARFSEYVNNPNTASLIRAVYGQEHLENLQRMARTTERLNIASNAANRSPQELNSLGPAANTVERIVRKPLDPYSGQAILARGATWLGRAIYGRSDREVARLFEQAMANPEMAKQMLRRVSREEFNRTAPRYGLRPMLAADVTRAENDEPR